MNFVNCKNELLCLGEPRIGTNLRWKFFLQRRDHQDRCNGPISVDRILPDFPIHDFVRKFKAIHFCNSLVDASMRFRWYVTTMKQQRSATFPKASSMRLGKWKRKLRKLTPSHLFCKRKRTQPTQPSLHRVTSLHHIVNDCNAHGTHGTHFCRGVSLKPGL